MAIRVDGIVVSRLAAQDLSASTVQNTIVALDSDGKVWLADAVTYQSFGVMIEGDVINQPCSIQISGIARVVLGATLAVNANVGAEASTGKAIAIATTAWSIGHLVEGGSEDDLGSVMLSSATVAV